MTGEIKVGFCVAYDWKYLKISLPLIYPYADSILLCKDKDNISWSGNSYYFDQVAFKNFIDSIDVDDKIQIYEDHFHQEYLSPMENEVRQRNIMADKTGKGGWHIQLDCDEYFTNFKKFVESLDCIHRRFKSDINVCIPFITLFKQVSNGYLLISGAAEWMPVASRKPIYKFGRRNGYFNYRVNSPVIHQSWARSDNEIESKLLNWGHKNDFDGQEFYNLWKSIDENNYKTMRNFHPIEPDAWGKLVFCNAETITDLLDMDESMNTLLKISKIELAILNNRWLARLKSISRKIIR